MSSLIAKNSSLHLPNQIFQAACHCLQFLFRHVCMKELVFRDFVSRCIRITISAPTTVWFYIENGPTSMGLGHPPFSEPLPADFLSFSVSKMSMCEEVLNILEHLR